MCVLQLSCFRATCGTYRLPEVLISLEKDKFNLSIAHKFVNGKKDDNITLPNRNNVISITPVTSAAHSIHPYPASVNTVVSREASLSRNKLHSHPDGSQMTHLRRGHEPQKVGYHPSRRGCWKARSGLSTRPVISRAAAAVAEPPPRRC